MARTMTYRRNISGGFTMVELLLALVVSSIILAAIYSSYLIIARQHQAQLAIAEVQELGLPALRFVERDLRMAGYKVVDANIESNFGAITDAIIITDSGNACCDSVEIVYDLDMDTRVRTSYYIAPRTNPDRNALYMDKEEWDGSAWNSTTTAALVSDYIEDFQLEGSDFNDNGDPRLVDVSMVVRSKKMLQRPEQTYEKPEYSVGNFDFTATDSYHRDEFYTTINVKNLRQVVY